MRIVDFRIARLFYLGTTGVRKCGRQQLCSAARLVPGNGTESPTWSGIWQGTNESYHWCGDKPKYSSSAWSQWQVQVAAVSSKVDGRGGSDEGASLQEMSEEERGKSVCSDEEENERGRNSVNIPNDSVGRTSFGRGSVPHKPVVAVGILGGVDSAVAALLLKEKVYAEVASIFGSERDLTREALVGVDAKKLKYLTMLIKEAIRLKPIVPYNALQPTRSTEISNGLVVHPRDIFVLLNTTVEKSEESFQACGDAGTRLPS